MITRISDYNFDITNFDLFKRANNNVPKELATIINAIASTFFLSLDSLHLKVLSLPFLLNAQSIHQKRDTSLSQKNAQVIVKTALCVIVGLVANKTKALIVAPLGIYLISKKLHFENRSPSPSPRPQVLTSSTIPNQEQQGTTESASLSTLDSSLRSSPLSSGYTSGEEVDPSNGLHAQQPSPNEEQPQVFFGIDPSMRSESSIGNQQLHQPCVNGEVEEFQEAPAAKALSISKTNAVSIGRPRPIGIWKPSSRRERQPELHFVAQGGEGAEAVQEPTTSQQPSKKNGRKNRNKNRNPNSATPASQ